MMLLGCPERIGTLAEPDRGPLASGDRRDGGPSDLEDSDSGDGPVDGRVQHDAGDAQGRRDAESQDQGTDQDVVRPPIQDSGFNLRPVGSECSEGSQCAQGLCLLGQQPWWDAEFDGGYCTRLGCDAQAPCPAGSVCFQSGPPETTVCLKECTTPSDCGRAGYECAPPGGCLPERTRGSSAIGGPCMVDLDCRDPAAICQPETGVDGPTGWHDGYCIQWNCGPQAPCPSGASCFTVGAQGMTVCLRPCDGLNPCDRPGYFCPEFLGACFPACTATSCPPRMVCDPSTRVCS